jgi:hypothetical protein
LLNTLTCLRKEREWIEARKKVQVPLKEYWNLMQAKEDLMNLKSTDVPTQPKAEVPEQEPFSSGSKAEVTEQEFNRSQDRLQLRKSWQHVKRLMEILELMQP